MSSKATAQVSRTKIIAVLSSAAIALFVSLLAVLWIGNSGRVTTGVTVQSSPMEKSYESFIDSRTKHLPEVQTFLHLYPNATMKNYYLDEGGAQYDFSSTVPSIHLDGNNNYFIEAVDLIVYVDHTPAANDTLQAGHQRHIGDYYFSPVFHCSPSSTLHPEESWFPEPVWLKSKAHCPSLMAQLNSPFVQPLSQNDAP